MAAAAGDGMLLRCGSYEGCISGSDVGKERRPYHRNCGCALHDRSENKNRKKSQEKCTGHKCKSVSYPMRRAWSEGNLGLAVSTSNSNLQSLSSPVHFSPSSSPAARPVHNRLGSFDQLGSLYETEEEDVVFF